MMPHVTGLIDVSAWTGTWPFDLNGDFALPRLADRLARAGIREALVSPLAAVLAPDPMPANQALLAECAGAGDLPVRFHPVPVVNPALATWREDLASIDDTGEDRCRAVRLLPTWHGWGPEHPEATEVVQAIAAHGLIPILQARMIDERAVPLSASPGVFDVQETAAWLRSTPDVPVVLAGLYRSELPGIADLSHVLVDLAFVESGDTLATVLETLPPERVVLGTHAPLLEPLATVVKLPVEGPHRDVAVRIGSDSARSCFSLPS
jgi:hypothetical protein